MKRKPTTRTILDESLQELIKQKHVEEIVLVRHGETTYNVAPRVGRYLASLPALIEAGCKADHLVELTKNGEEQAKRAGEFLKAEFLDNNQTFDAYFDSGYKRSIQTLDIILKEFKEFSWKESNPQNRRSHLDLRERDPGYTLNMTITQVNQYFPWFQEYEKTVGMFYAVPPGGESIADVCLRVHMFLKSLRHARQTRERRRVLIVTHGRVILCFRFWLEKFLASDVERLFDKEEEIENCQIVRYTWNEETDRYDKIKYTFSERTHRYETTRYVWNVDKRLFEKEKVSRACS